MTANPGSSADKRHPATARHARRWTAALTCLGLLLVLPLTPDIAERLRTSISREVESGSAQLGWYFRSGRWLADVRTFSAACEYIMRSDSTVTTPCNPSGIQLAAPDSETAPDQSGARPPQRHLVKDS